jgi:hypothetical protein
VGFAGHTSARRPGAGRTVCVGVGSGGGATEIDRFISLLTCSSLHLGLRHSHCAQSISGPSIQCCLQF